MSGEREASCPADEDLARLLPGAAGDDAVRAHVLVCGPCQASLEGLGEVLSGGGSPSPDLDARLRELLPALPRPRRIRWALPAAAALLLAAAGAWQFRQGAGNGSPNRPFPVTPDHPLGRALILEADGRIEAGDEETTAWLATGGEIRLSPGGRARLVAESGGVLELLSGAAWVDLRGRAGAPFQAGNARFACDQACFWASMEPEGAGLASLWLHEALAGTEGRVTLGVREGRLDPGGGARPLLPGDVARWEGRGAWTRRTETEAERRRWGAGRAVPGAAPSDLLSAEARGKGWRLAPRPGAFAHLLWTMPERPYAVSAAWLVESEADAGLVWRWEGKTCFWVPVGRPRGAVVSASVVVDAGGARGFLDGREAWRIPPGTAPAGFMDYRPGGVGIASRGPLALEGAEMRTLP